MRHFTAYPALAPLLALVLAGAGCGGNDDPGLTTSGESSSSSSTGDPSTGVTDQPGVCGDGVVDDGEECDEGADNGETRPCTPKCTAAACGDGFVGPGEGCDDGNVLDGDGCTSVCQDPGCGDMVVSVGESCDDGNLDNSDGCLNSCELASCGDGFVHEGEEVCDDGNGDNSDLCLASCLPASCGDGFVQEGVEVCDDGNADSSDACLADCRIATCGDGFVQEGVEACDDGNKIDVDLCQNDCSNSASCSDGVKNGSESDVDCGGEHCNGCLEGQICAIGSDCGSGYCDAKACVTPKNCREIRDLGLGTEDGVYFVDPDGSDGGGLLLEVYCEMTFDGGGWTAVYNMREKPIGEAAATEMLASISQNGPIGVVTPNSTSDAIYTEGLVLADFTEVVYGWAPTISADVTRYGRHVDPAGLAGKCYLDGFCGKGVDVGEFDIVPTGNTRMLQTGKVDEFPHVGLGFDNQIILWGYDRNASHFSNWANWYDEGLCCKAGNTDEIETPGWRYVIYLR